MVAGKRTPPNQCIRIHRIRKLELNKRVVDRPQPERKAQRKDSCDQYSEGAAKDTEEEEIPFLRAPFVCRSPSPPEQNHDETTLKKPVVTHGHNDEIECLGTVSECI